MRAEWPDDRDNAPRAGSRPLTTAPAWLAPVAGIGLGVAAALGDQVPFVGWVANYEGVWLLFAFGVGWLYRDPARGAVAGLVATLAAVASYYLLLLFVFEPRTAVSALIRAGVIWSFIGLIAGPCGGIAGALARIGANVVRVVSTGLVCGIAAGEAFWNVSQMWRLSDQLLYGIGILLALVVPWMVLKRPAHVGVAYGVAALTGGIVSLFIPVAFEVGRSIGI